MQLLNVILWILSLSAFSISAKAALSVFEYYAKKSNTDSARLIYLAIHLHCHKEIDMKLLKRIVAEVSPNPVCMHILKSLVINHTYMFPVDRSVKYRLSSLLDVSMQQQVLGDLDLTLKG